MELFRWIISHFKPETQSKIIGILFIVGVICLGIALSVMFGGCKTRYCCPQCHANHDDINLAFKELDELHDAVDTIKRGYRTVPVVVTITNAWDFTDTGIWRNN